MGLILGLAAVMGGALAVGYSIRTVMSGSMEPSIGTGDLVVNRPIPPLDARVGDVVTFEAPGESHLITHRVRKIQVRGFSVGFVTRGDANTGVERWSVQRDGRIGKVEHRLPKLGYAMAQVRAPWGRIAFVVVPAVLLGIFELRHIWRPRPRHAAAGGEAPRTTKDGSTP
jgi:signal peptidase